MANHAASHGCSLSLLMRPRTHRHSLGRLPPQLEAARSRLPSAGGAEHGPGLEQRQVA